MVDYNASGATEPRTVHANVAAQIPAWLTSMEELHAEYRALKQEAEHTHAHAIKIAILEYILKVRAGKGVGSVCVCVCVFVCLLVVGHGGVGASASPLLLVHSSLFPLPSILPCHPPPSPPPPTLHSLTPQDPSERERLRIRGMPRPFVPQTMRAPVPWHEQVVEAADAMESSLKITHPILSALLKLWHSDFVVSLSCACVHVCVCVHVRARVCVCACVRVSMRVCESTG